MIDTELAGFLEEGIAIQLGTRNARLEPGGVHVVAVAVEDGGTHLVAYVAEAAAGPVLADLEANGQAAIAFSRPPDERACQVKGLFVSARPARADEREFVQGQWRRWLDRLATIGLPHSTFGHWPCWPCVAIRLRPTQLFNQTPGPGAGAPLA